MRKSVLFVLTTAIIALSSCSKPKGQLTGIYENVNPEATPYGMVHIPRGSFVMGPNDQSAIWAIQPSQRDVTVESFWMDITEITNGEYKQFVYWVRDSIARTQLARMEVDVLGVEAEDAKYFTVKYDPYNEAADPDTILNWKVKIPWNAKWTYEGDEEENATYLAVNSVFYQSGDKTEERQLNAHIMNYSYQWLARDQARRPGNSFNPKTGKYHDWAEVTIDTAYYDETGKIINKVIKKKLRQRGDLISRRIINIYPDTMCWMTEFTYSYNEPAMLNYFSHPSYGMFPVVGVTWEQAQAFCHWCEQNASCSRIPSSNRSRMGICCSWWSS